MKTKTKNTIIISSMLGLSMVALLFAPMSPFKVEAEVIQTLPTVDAYTITASGQATITTTPDMATINIGVSTENDDVVVAQKENIKRMSAVTESLKSNGIKEKEMTTVNYSIHPRSRWDELKGESIVTGYNVNNGLSVRVNDISKIGKIIDDVVSVGGNQVNGISFGVSDESAFYNEALELAVKDAQVKALAMGKGVDAKNIKAVKIVENGMRSQPIMYESMKSMDMMANSVTPIQEGEMEINANVTVEFKFNY